LKVSNGVIMSHPAVLLKQHLMNFYARLDKTDKELADFMQRLTDEIHKLEAQKLSAQEFHEFVDIFNKSLAESLPLPRDESVKTNERPPEEASSGPKDVGFQREATVVLNTQSNGASQIVETPKTQDVTEQNVARPHPNFPMKVKGDVFYVGDGVTSVVGDAEIPAGTMVDETLVVKGNFKVGEGCKLLKNIKALRDIEIGANTMVEGNVISGGKITVGSNCILHGSIESDGDTEIDQNVIIEGSLRSKSSIKLNQLTKVFQTLHAEKGVFVLKATKNV